MSSEVPRGRILFSTLIALVLTVLPCRSTGTTSGLRSWC